MLIVDLGAIAYPSDLSPFETGHGENGRFHAELKKTESFGHIDDVELNVGAFGYVSDTEVEPLIVSLGIDVIL